MRAESFNGRSIDLDLSDKCGINCAMWSNTPVVFRCHSINFTKLLYTCKPSRLLTESNNGTRIPPANTFHLHQLSCIGSIQLNNNFRSRIHSSGIFGFFFQVQSICFRNLDVGAKSANCSSVKPYTFPKASLSRNCPPFRRYFKILEIT